MFTCNGLLFNHESPRRGTLCRNMASACYVIALLWLLAGLTRIWLCSMLNSLSYYDFYYFEVILFYMKESLYCL